ncbi:hypothetical protein [Streptomyces sp. NPDC005181]|uniref:hypothetical protein n=1 Tax=Streptomyces sp. NPDC005181 TaxID=3156869 RepID=UPI0033B86642
MPSPARLVTGTAAAALTVAAFGLFTAAPSAYAGDLGSLEISPAGVPPGSTVTVKTTACGSDAKATGHANVLEAGVFTLAPSTGREALVGMFKVPTKADAGPYSVGVSCANGKRITGGVAVTAAGTGQSAGKAIGRDDGKDTGQDNASGDDPGTGSGVPSLDDLAARGESLLGNQNPFGLGNSAGRDTGNEAERDTGDGDGGRDTGNGNSGRDTGGGDGGRDTGNGNSGRDTGGGDGGRDTGNGDGGGDTGGGDGGRDTGNGDGGGDSFDSPTGPSGHVKTGVGGSVRSDTTQIAAGAGVLAASAVGGAWLLRRRASGTQAGS